MEAPHTPPSILSLYISKQNIGICYYNQPQLKIQCSLLQSYTPCSKKLLDRLLEQKKAQILLTNNNKHPFIAYYNQEERFMGKILKINERGLEDDIIENNISLLRFNPTKQPVNNKNQYIKMMRQNSEGCGIAKEKYKALGILLYYLLNEDSLGIISKIYLNDIQYFFDWVLNGVQIGNSELEYLQIIKQQVHPSLVKGKGKSKQGFSILSLYQTPLSSTGSKKILRNIFKNPTFDKKTLQSRLDLIAWIRYHCVDHKPLIKIFRSIHTIDTILRKFMDSRAQNQDWRKLVRTLQSMIILHKMIQEKVKGSVDGYIPEILKQFFDDIDWGQIARVLSTVTTNVDLQQGTIKRGVDPQLDQLKKTYDNLPHLLTLYARQQNWPQDFRIVFMSQIGYLIRVPHEYQPESFPQLQTWTLQFVKNSGKFYCNQLTNLLDDQYGDIYGEISDREKKIWFQLEGVVVEHADTIQGGYWGCCQLECMVGVAIVSNGMCRPKFSAQSLIVSRGWHFLLAQDAIQNHCFSFNQLQAPKQRIFNSQQNLVNTNYSNRLMLITGPNGSGKTVYLKQNTIILYLAHLGFYVPAQFAELPLVDRIVLVESKRSIYGCNGTGDGPNAGTTNAIGSHGFQSEISSLSKICADGMITNRSVVLIDQFGSSIDSIFAKKILSAVIKYLSDPTTLYPQSPIPTTSNSFVPNPLPIPLTIIITHLSDLISQKLVEQNYNIRYLTMDIQKDKTYLYKIRPGIVKKGYGIECARLFMQEGFVNRAEWYWRQLRDRDRVIDGSVAL